MASKREELKAWNKLKKAFPKSYKSLTFEYNNYESEYETFLYRAYTNKFGPTHGEYCNTPMEAVDNLIQKVREANHDI